MKKWKELFSEARDLYTKAASAESIQEAEELEAQADELVQRATIAQKAEGIEFEADDGDGVPTPTADKITDTMVREGYSDEAIKAVLGALDRDNGDGGHQQQPKKDFGFSEFLAAVRADDEASLKSMGSRKVVEEGDGVSGGYLVPEQQLSELLMVDEGEAVVRPRARKIRMNSRTLTIPVLDQGDTPGAYWKLDYDGGVLSYWTAESGAKTETEPEFEQLELMAHKLAGYTQASDEVVADSAVGIEPLLVSLFRRSIARREDFAFLRGTGVGMPLGILNANCLVTQDRATANTIEYRDLARMMDQILPSAYGGAYWVVDVTALPQLLQMEDGAGNNVWIPNAVGGVSEGLPGTIYGRPVVITEKLPNLGSTGDVLLANFNYYLIGDRQMTSIDSSKHYAFVNDKMTWRFVHRVDGQPWLPAPIYIDTTNTVSAFVALHANTTS